ncbi:salivary peroxidase/catechol oxidase [Penaeus vannamei]|uniref:salivary peroxidase/catechol oxidase n=1 Tax=Penaeus vannamei TaxID=6689 RepID=UPI00387F834F
MHKTSLIFVAAALAALLTPIVEANSEGHGEVIYPSRCNAFLHFRSIDGTCNNLRNPTWGAAYEPYRRLAGHNYGDGISSLPTASDGAELPTARLVSLAVGSLPNSSPASRSFLHVLFGFFLALDVTATPLLADADGQPTSCCPKFSNAHRGQTHPDCASVILSATGPSFSELEQRCMEFLRSAPAAKCESGPRDQVNAATAYLDASMVYGSARRTRSTDDGHVRVTDENVFNRYQFLYAPDVWPLVNMFYRMVTRYHNNVADRLKEINVDWDGERLFQETRRIVVAQLQHVVYNEYLPKILGLNAMNKYELTPLTGSERREDYDASENAATSSEFETAALRFSQSQRPESIEFANGEVTEVELSSPTLAESLEHTPSQVLRAVSRQAASKVVFAKELYFGIDLLARSIQRGRDHGLGGYVAVRVARDNTAINTFDDLTESLGQDVSDNLKTVYNDVRDIDLLIGGAFEQPVPDGVLGPTFTSVLAEQFSRILKADRYWYETNIKETRFKDDQLEALHSTTLAAIMCDAFPELEEIQERPFEVVSAENKLVPCKRVPPVGLEAWKP